jgi:hypothetical protein
MGAHWPEKLRKRRDLVELQMRRMYLSAGQPVPGDVTLAFRMEDAMLLWERIPDANLPAVVTRALIESEGYVPGNGHVMRTWRDMREEEDKKILEAEHARRSEAWKKIPPTDPETCSRTVREVLQRIGN